MRRSRFILCLSLTAVAVLVLFGATLAGGSTSRAERVAATDAPFVTHAAVTGRRSIVKLLTSPPKSRGRREIADAQEFEPEMKALGPAVRPSLKKRITDGGDVLTLGERGSTTALRGKTLPEFRGLGKGGSRPMSRGN